jgi:hypothetical protein
LLRQGSSPRNDGFREGAVEEDLELAEIADLIAAKKHWMQAVA